jgi:pyrroloquinoline-quinone synthase
MNFFDRLEQARQRHDVLTHSFYERWSAGELTRDELTVYAGQYRHAVQALADASANAARAAEPAVRVQLELHAAEEDAHVNLWDGFGGAVAATRDDATPETEACATAWAGEGRDFLGHLVVLYAIESGQPAISETKLTGLREHYGIDDERGTGYFRLHATLDHEHAAAARELIEERLADADQDSLLAEAEAVLAANWDLLDGVERLNGRG